MKKLMAIMLVAMMTIVMCACGNSAQEESSEVANPVHECTQQEMLEATGMELDAPEGATDVVYSYIDGEEPIAQITFELNDEDFCYRAQPTGITSLGGEIKTDELMAEEDLQSALDAAVETGATLAGLNYKWDVAALVDVPASREGVYAIHDDEEGFIAWLDVAPGILYSLSTDDATVDLLMNTAETIFVPVQGDVG